MAKRKIDEYDVNYAVDTLIKAQEILNDKQMLPKVKKAFAKKQQALRETASELKLESKVAEKQKAMGDK